MQKPRLQAWLHRGAQLLFAVPARQDYLYYLPNEVGNGRVFIGERQIKGDFVKFNNNGGSVNKEDHRHHCVWACYNHFNDSIGGET